MLQTFNKCFNESNTAVGTIYTYTNIDYKGLNCQQLSDILKIELKDTFIHHGRLFTPIFVFILEEVR